MARVVSALVLLPIVVGAVWFLPPIGTLVLALIAAALAFAEYVALASALGVAVPHAVPGAAVLGACAALGSGWTIVDVILMTALITIAATAVGTARLGPEVLRDCAAAIFPAIYIGLPLGALAAVRATAGREAVLLIMAVIVISDSAQYYTGRAFGKRPLAPAISPGKTWEGVIGALAAVMVYGIVIGAIAPGYPGQLLAGLLWAAVLTGVSIEGDLFESWMKRLAGLKDSGALLPGHGGLLDRVDALCSTVPLAALYFAYPVLRG